MARGSVLLTVALLAFVLSVAARKPPPRKNPPPPPPPSPSPPPPPAAAEFPHTCQPGNVKPSGIGAGIDCTPYKVSFVSSLGNNHTYIITTKAADARCATVNSKYSECRTMDMADIKFSINRECWGTVSGVAYRFPNGTSIKRSAVYARETYPSNPAKEGTTFRIVFQNALDLNTANNVRVSFSLNQASSSACKTLPQFFTSAGAQYAYYGKVKSSCCGTATA